MNAKFEAWLLAHRIDLQTSGEKRAAVVFLQAFVREVNARAEQKMGGSRLVTYTLKTESGCSLRGAGWKVVGETKPVKEGWRKNDHLNLRREWQPVMGQQKLRWEVTSPANAVV